MGQEPGTGRTTVTDTQHPEELREQIEETREELGDTVEALAAKTDVKARARAKVEESKSAAAEKKNHLLGKARDVSPDSAAGVASQMSERTRANPLPLAAAGAFLAGFVTGRAMLRRKAAKSKSWRLA